MNVRSPCYLLSATKRKKGKTVFRKSIQLLYNIPIFQMNRLIISYRQAYVEFPIEASAGPKAH